MKTVELYMIHGTVQYNGEIRAWERDPLVEKILSVRCVEGHHIPQAGPKVFPTCCVSLAIV